MPRSSATPLAHVPFSWTFDTWPADVFPFTGSKARHIVKCHGGELRAAGALTRPTKKLVILGAGYAKWLASKAPRVTEFEIAPNSSEHAAKRFGRHRRPPAVAPG